MKTANNVRILEDNADEQFLTVKYDAFCVFILLTLTFKLMYPVMCF